EILRIEHARKIIFDKHILNDFKINVLDSEIVSLCGVRAFENDLLLDFFEGRTSLDKGRFYFMEKFYDITRQTLHLNGQILCIRKKPCLVQQLSVGENLFVVKHNARKFFLNRKAVYQQTAYLLSKYKLSLPPKSRIQDLSIADQHIVELIRASIQNIRLIVLEDIAMSYSESERQMLLHTVRLLQKQGIALIYLSFYPSCITDISSRILLMYAGSHLRTLYPGECTLQELTGIINRQHPDPSSFINRQYTGKEIFVIAGLQYGAGIPALNLQLHEGEILGIYDNEALFAKKIVEAILITGTGGNTFRLSGKIYTPQGLPHAVQSGIVYIPNFFYRDSYLDNLSGSQNLSLPLIRKTRRAGLLINRHIEDYSWSKLEELLNDYFPEDSIDGIYKEICIVYYHWILYRPKIIVCLDPFSYGDSLIRKIITVFLRMAVSMDIGILLLSHDYNDLTQLSDRVIRIT
ncbi:MAG TPA: hypothetical protein PLU43_09100, partial [Lachnospiraceae bacterium]|nr:hypothetical protein [Lachnospiraceae bacterium]